MTTSSPRTAVVTGASRGVGRAITTRLLNDGWVVYGQYKTAIPEDLTHPNLQWWHADFLTDELHPPALARVDALVLSAGIARLGGTTTAPRRDWEEHMAVNLHAPVQLTAMLVPALQAAGGHVVYINSGAGKASFPQWGPYAASKFAARAWMDALRGEHPELRVTSVFPGRIATDMQKAIRAQEGGEYTPEQYLQPEDLADLVVGALNAPVGQHQPDITPR